MIKILKGSDVKRLDKLACDREEIQSYELMERAGLAFEKWFYEQDFSKDRNVLIFVGAGNNGGDGLVIARLISQKNFQVTVVKCFPENAKLSSDSARNLEMLPTKVKEVFLKDFEVQIGFPIIIDAFLGVGFNGELREDAQMVVSKINELYGYKISIDIPSGLHSEGISRGLVVISDLTFTLASPKEALLIPENANLVGDLVVGDIQIDPELYNEFEGEMYFLQESDVPALHKKFTRFSHKGDFGKILLVGGSLGKMGAMVLASKSALRTGAGLVTCHVEESEHHILQTSVPEVMCNWGLIPNAGYYDAIGIGPGWGLDHRRNLMELLLKDFHKPIVVDADGINLLAKHPEIIEKLPKGSILTPHVGEFGRLIGEFGSHIERVQKAKEFATKHQLILVLKGANTVISLPDGRQVVNSSGSPYMATAGSGDTLTGMITAYLGMGYSSDSAALCGVYHHGLAGEIAGAKKRRGTIASDIIEAIPETYLKLNV